MSWIIASHATGLVPAFFIAIDADDKPVWTDSDMLAHRFHSREQAESYGESVDMGQPLEAMSLGDEVEPVTP